MKTPSPKIIFSVTALLTLMFVASQALPGSRAEAQTTAIPGSGATPGDPSSGAPAGVPVNIPPNSPLAQVIQLVQSGVSEDVILAYITNSSSAFNLDSGTIIYLSNLGAPDELATAMMQHDQQLQSQAVVAQIPPPASQPEPAAAPVPPTDEASQQPVSVDYFYNSLAPYGAWVVVPGYGRCWRPTTMIYNSDWQPYSDHGHWVYTDYGWYWVSDYAWGATFHYGRWFRDSRLGWCWWPDTVWGPSWVTWRYSDAYCGWAPLPPFTVFRGGAFYYRGAAVAAGFNFGLSVNLFTFVPTRNFVDRHLAGYRVGRNQMADIYRQTAVVNHFSVNNRRIVNAGIAPADVTRVTRTAIRQYPVSDLRRPGGIRYPVNHGVNQPGPAGHSNPANPGGTSRENPGSQQRNSPGYAPNPARNVGTPYHATENAGSQRAAGQSGYYYTQPPQAPAPNESANTTRGPRNWQSTPAPTQPRYTAPPNYYSEPAPRQNDQFRQGNYSAPPARNDPPAAHAAPAPTQSPRNSLQNQNNQQKGQNH